MPSMLRTIGESIDIAGKRLTIKSIQKGWVELELDDGTEFELLANEVACISQVVISYRWARHQLIRLKYVKPLAIPVWPSELICV